MDPTQFDDARKYVPTLKTDSVDAFRRALAAVDFPWTNPTAIEWWKATREERVALEKLVAPGREQVKCRTALSNFCTPISPESALGAIQGAVTAEFDRSGWFKYYYYEANGAVGGKPDGDPSRALVIDIANSFFAKAGGAFYTKRSYDSVDATPFKQLLYVLLTIGFDRVPATKEHLLAGDSSSAMIMNYMRWAGDAPAAGLQTPDGDVKRVQAQFKWRCDSRPYDAVSRSNGFLTKANSDGYASSKNLRAAWHPFSDEGPRSYLWFRKGQTDNCLYSVVSVGTGDWQAFAVYPKISLSGGKASMLNGYLGTRRVRVRDAKSAAKKEVELAVSETYLYLFLQVGLVFDTGAAQGGNAYPEVGMAGIPMRNIYGALRFVRYHLGPPDSVSDDDGMVVVVDRAGVHTNDDDARSIEASCGQDLYQAATRLFNKVRDAPPTGVRWTPNGYSMIAFGTPFDYGGANLVIDQVLTA